MKNLSKKHLKHLWNRYLFYSNYYTKEILNPEDLPIHQWNDQKENNLFRRLKREGEKLDAKSI